MSKSQAFYLSTPRDELSSAEKATQTTYFKMTPLDCLLPAELAIRATIPEFMPKLPVDRKAVAARAKATRKANADLFVASRRAEIARLKSESESSTPPVDESELTDELRASRDRSESPVS